MTDEQWRSEEQFNPNYVSTPWRRRRSRTRVDTFHTHCEWNNTSTEDQLFPDEMGDGIGFYFPSNGQIPCENGGWPQ